MIRSIIRNPFSRFLILSSVLYLGWHFAYSGYLQSETKIDDLVIDNLVVSGEKILHTLGYLTTDYSIDGQFRSHFGVEGTSGVTIGAPCDGIVLFALFTVFMISYPGPIKHKLWFTPLGLLIIHVLNIARVTGLALIVYYNEGWLAFNHDYTFTIFVYAVVFALWLVWINRFAKPKSTTNANA
ncbi:MAG: exosortase X [Flavobacteriales bacterium]|jgi:exosortase family protein XrtF